MGGPEDNPADEQQITKEEWDAWEREAYKDAERRDAFDEEMRRDALGFDSD